MQWRPALPSSGHSASIIILFDIMHIFRRPARLDDIPFLLTLRCQTMDQHLAASGLGTSEADHRVRILYRFDCAEILLRGATPVGLLKLLRDGVQWQLIQIQLSPALQGQGVGSQLLASTIAEAAAAGATLSLGVLKTNPAKVLYERFGFIVVAEDDHSYQMHRRANGGCGNSR
jgi:ribosomal protein S18 acetylase RimI-like enzyme